MENEAPQEIPQQAPPSPENSNRSFWKTIAIGMSIASFGIVIAVGGYLLGVSKNKPAEVSTSQITTIPTPTPTIDPTANWKTYTNTQYGFSFKYPESWQPSIDANSIIVPGSFKESEPFGYSIGAKIYEGTNFAQMSADEFVRNVYYGPPTDDFDKEFKESVLKEYSIKTEIKNGVTFYVIDGLQRYVGYSGIAAWTTNKNYAIFISSNPSSHGTEENLKMFNQILSTFRFD